MTVSAWIGNTLRDVSFLEQGVYEGGNCEHISACRIGPGTVRPCHISETKTHCEFKTDIVS